MKRELCWIGLLTAFGATLLAAKYFGWLTTGDFGSLARHLFRLLRHHPGGSGLLRPDGAWPWSGMGTGTDSADLRSGQDNRSREEQS